MSIGLDNHAAYIRWKNEAKTKGEVRIVPIHPCLKPLIKKLIKDSNNDYLVTDQNNDTHGKKSNALIKRFNRLKVRPGFGSNKVFHSKRKTVITIFENHKTPEGVSADIVGHEKKTMTYGLYSGGSGGKFKFDAIKKIRL